MSRDLARSPRSTRGTVAQTALTPLVWGTTYIVATEFLPPGRPLLAAMMRALPIGLIFVLRTRELPHRIWWWRAAVLGVLNIGAFFALLFVAAFRLPGGVAATAGAIQPIIAGAIAAVLLGERFTTRTASAGAAGVAGVALLVLGPEAALDPVGIAAALGGTLSMATGVVLTKRWGRPVDLVTFTGWQLTIGGAVLVPIVLVFEGLPPSLTTTHAAGFLWLGVIGTGAAYANWFNGVHHLPVNVVSFLGLLSPLVATLMGWLALGESLSLTQLGGAVLVIAAVLGPHMNTPELRLPRNHARRVAR